MDWLVIIDIDIFEYIANMRYNEKAILYEKGIYKNYMKT